MFRFLALTSICKYFDIVYSRVNKSVGESTATPIPLLVNLRSPRNTFHGQSLLTFSIVTYVARITVSYTYCRFVGFINISGINTQSIPFDIYEKTLLR